MRFSMLVSAGLLMAATTTGFAQGTAEQQAACQPDAKRFCEQVGVDQQRIAQCLGQNFRRLSPACRQVMKFGTVQNICAGSIAQFCAGAAGSIPATLACLQQRAAALPANCRNAVRAARR